MNAATVVIVSHNNAATLAQCIQAARSAGAVQTVVVDNASSDTSAAIAAALGATVVPNKKNMGFATAANQGALLANTPYLLFLNPDTVLAPSAITETIRYVEKHPNVDVIGLALTDPKTGHIEADSFGQFPTLWQLFSRKLFPPLPLNNKGAIPVDWVSGGALMIRHRVWQEVKGFDPGFFLYWEDVDLCRRVKNLKPEHHPSSSRHTIVILPAAICYHQRGASLTDKKRKAQLYDAGADRYFRKHYPGIIWWIQHYLRRFYRLLQPYSR